MQGTMQGKRGHDEKEGGVNVEKDPRNYTEGQRVERSEDDLE